MATQTKGENPQLFAEERKERILDLLEENSKILVPELSEMFEVSQVTIRGYLRDLENEGKLRRTHGGAIPVGKSGDEPDSRRKAVEHIAEKQRIAQAAAALVEDGDVVALDTGTTTLELAKALSCKKHLTIVTNDLNIASFMEDNSDASVVLIGGTLRRGFHCTTGPMAIAAFKGINADIVFVAANGFSLEQGFSTPSVDHAEMKRSLMGMASKCVMIMDSSKVGKVSFISFASIYDIDRLITDSGIGRRVTEAIEAQSDNLELQVV
jgi:DeoR family fructose operon transcriptional repressor